MFAARPSRVVARAALSMAPGLHGRGGGDVVGGVIVGAEGSEEAVSAMFARAYVDEDEVKARPSAAAPKDISLGDLSPTSSRESTPRSPQAVSPQSSAAQSIYGSRRRVIMGGRAKSARAQRERRGVLELAL